MINEAYDDDLHKWKNFDFINSYLQDRLWVYEGYGRWIRRNSLLRIVVDNNKYILERWDVGLMIPRLLSRNILDGDLTEILRKVVW